MKRLLFAFFILWSGNCFCQQIGLSGRVSNNGVALPSVTLQLKNAANLQLIAYSISDQDGFYQLKASIDSIKSLYLIAGYIGLKRDTLKIDAGRLQAGSTITHNFNLTDDARQLDEIKIIANTPPVIKTNDTVKYKVARFTSPEDQNIESVIKKMPGITVSKDGAIYFNQQKITRVLLEGDDMTGDNYKTITQNLKPQLVEEVQAIENYVEDDLMNGVISSDEVVLNLKVKDKKSISGSLDLGYGTNNRNDVSANLISFTKKFKAFTFINSNNTGKYQEDLLSLGDKTGAVQSRKLINHAIEDTNPFDNNHFRLNNSFAGSISAISRVTDDLKITLGIYGISNKLYDERSQNQLFYTADTVRIANKENRNSNNQIYEVELTADQRLNKTSRLLVTFSTAFKPEKYYSTSFTSFNNNTPDSVNQYQADQFKGFSGSVKYVAKLNATTAIIATLQNRLNDLSQNYNVASTLYNQVPDFNNASNLLQLAAVKTNNFQADVQALKKSGYNYFYANIGYYNQVARIATSLYNSDNKFDPQLLADKFINANTLIARDAYMTGKYTFNNNSIKLQALLTGSLRRISVYDQSTAFFVWQPEFLFNAKVSESQTFKIRYALENKAPNSLEYYKNNVLTDVRNVNSGLGQINSFYTQNLELGYINNSFSSDYFTFQVNGGAQYSPQGFLTRNFFDNTIYYSQRSIYKGIKVIRGNLVFQKFIPLISTNLSLDMSTSKSNYYAAIGQTINPYSDINKTLVLFASTGFKLPINFAAEFRYLQNNTFLSDLKINANNSYKYSFVIKSKIGKQWFHIASHDLYRLNGTNYQILNTELLYQPARSALSYSLQGVNLFNVKTFTNTYVSNVQELTSSTNLLGRYLLFKISLAIK